VTLLDETQGAETTVGGFGTRPGELSSPSGVAFARDGAFYVSDTDNARVQVFSGVGNWVASLEAPLREPRGLAVDRDGNLYVADASGAVHAFVHGGRAHATLEWPDAQPLDVAVHGDTLWVLTREPATLLRVRIARGD
jgi:sugar lactone lactonase YvrE